MLGMVTMVNLVIGVVKFLVFSTTGRTDIDQSLCGASDSNIDCGGFGIFDGEKGSKT